MKSCTLSIELKHPGEAGLIIITTPEPVECWQTGITCGAISRPDAQVGAVWLTIQSAWRWK